MRASQLNRAVALKTGEPVSEIRRRGFGLADPTAEGDESLQPQIVDWDELDSQRRRQVI